MGKKVPIRDVSPFLKTIRDFLLGRSHISALRFESEVATRSPLPPNIPGGPAHRINSNYYYARDGRREVAPPTAIAGSRAQISDSEKPQIGQGKLRTPGTIHRWD